MKHGFQVQTKLGKVQEIIVLRRERKEEVEYSPKKIVVEGEGSVCGVGYAELCCAVVVRGSIVVL